MSPLHGVLLSLGLHPTALQGECLLLTANHIWSSLATEEDGGPSWSVSSTIHMKDCGWSAQQPCGAALAALAPELQQPHPLYPRKHWSLWAASRSRCLGNLGAASYVYSSVSSCTPDILGVKNEQH